MNHWDTLICADAWESLVAAYRELEKRGDDLNDFVAAQLLRDSIRDVEG